jgi:hypothetical protein
MQFRIYDRQTLAYKDGGYVASYTIDDDYIVNNNSTITIVKALNEKVVEGDTIVLIKTSGAYHKGTITTFDNSDYKITYKSDKELFNNNILNPLRHSFIEEVEEGDRIYTSFGIDYIADIIQLYFGGANDIYRRLPLKVYTDGDVVSYYFVIKNNDDLKVVNFDEEKFREKIKSEGITGNVTFSYRTGIDLKGHWYLGRLLVNRIDLADYGIETNGKEKTGLPIETITVENKQMVWTWEDNQINFVDWLVDIFEKYNVVLSWDIDFDIANPIKTELKDGKFVLDNKGNIVLKNERNANYIIRLSALTNSPKIIKDNVNEVMQMITYTEKQLPEATVCSIIDKESKEIVMLASGKNLLNPNLGETNKFLGVTEYGEQKTDDTSSNISGYIKVEEGKTYIFSSNVWDDKQRNVMFYDKSKNAINNKKDDGTLVGSYFLSLTNYKGAKISIAEETGIKYIKICYYNKATEVQLEEGEVVTGYDAYNTPAIYYLYEDDGKYYVSLKQDERKVIGEGENAYSIPLRVLPTKMKIVEYDGSSDNLTPEKVAQDTLIPNKFNQAIEIQLSSDSKMFDFNSKFGDYYKIINKSGTIDSVYTGRKETSNDKWVRLYFGLGRQNYTDLMQMRLRKNKYKVVYNQDQIIE